MRSPTKVTLSSPGLSSASTSRDPACRSSQHLAAGYLGADDPALAVELDRIRQTIITGHGEPIVGKDRIAADIDKMHAAVSWVRDYTLDGMNTGKTVHQLMRAVALPDHLTIGEFHGKVSWAVKTIWEKNSGWLHYEDGTTELYGVPRSAVNADLVELAGGDALAARARAHTEAGRPLEALHLTDILLGANPNDKAAWQLKKIASEHLLVASGSRNLSETMWLKSEIAAAEAMLGKAWFHLRPANVLIAGCAAA